ncbi:MAG: carboxypeptidase-like regulatory domain-containing protein [Candidatus Eisenbacteria bacterium]
MLMTSVMALAGLVLSGRSLAAPPAGTPIVNTANGTATLSAGGGSISLVSNSVRAIVQPAQGLLLTPDRFALVMPGSPVRLRHTLTNPGNSSAEIRLSAANARGDGFDVAGFALTYDRDADGILSSADTPIADGGTLTLAAGASAELLFDFNVPDTAPSLSRARLTLTGQRLDGGGSSMVRDSVDTLLLPGSPNLGFYASAAYGTPTRLTPLGAPLFVQANAPQCNRDFTRPDTVSVTIHSLLTGDMDGFLAIETGPSTGVFRILPGAPTTNALTTTSQNNDGVVTQLRGDRLTAVLAGCGAPETRAQAWVEPQGVVFDARSDVPVGGARVQLIDLTGAGNGGQPGALARVYDSDGVTPASAEVFTASDGGYRFALVPPSSYRVVVTPAAPDRFPSLVPFAQLPAGHLLDAAASYGGPFVLTDPLSPVRLDLPVDDLSPVALFAEKRASRASVEPGDLLDYEVRLANRSDSTLTEVVLRDALPVGFALVLGTARRDGSGPVECSGSGPALAFALGALAPRSEVHITYRVRVTPGASMGMAVNTAWAEAGRARSNDATARVEVRGDAFAAEGAIVGSVTLAAEPAVRHGERGLTAGTLGLAGVRLYLDDGSFAVTDEHGRYSLAGISPRTHALKVDATTLPPMRHLVALDRRDGQHAGLRFIDLSRGELVRADFAVSGDTTSLREAEERRLVAHHRDERNRALIRAADPREPAPLGDPRSLPAAGITSGEGALPNLGMHLETRPASANPEAVVAVTLDRLLDTLDSDLGFIGLADLDTMTSNQIAVRVKGRLGTTLALRVNGRTLPESRVGQRLSAPGAGLEAWEYVGVALRPGLNVLEVAPPRSVGRVALRLVAPGPFARLSLSVPRGTRADGHAIASLLLRVTDAEGVPVGARTLVTLESSLGRLASEDLDPATAGVQVAVEDGALRVGLVSPEQPGSAHLTAVSGETRATATVEFVPDLRPLLAVGAVEGVLSLQSLSHRGSGVRGIPEAGFEAPISQFLSQRVDGRASAGAHGALFMKGRVRNDMQITLGYDSDRDAAARLFRDQQPDRGYPLFGDAALRGYDAQSAGRLYARLERRDAALAYGDFTTSASGRSLANFGRSLTGAEARWSADGHTVRAFSSRTRTTRAVEELRGKGISGPYALARAPLVENSERVEILVRDRSQPALVISARTQQRFTDYEIEPVTGRLLFRFPIPSVTAELEPVSIRVTYETETGGEPVWVQGADARLRVTPRLEVGGTYVDDHDVSQPLELRGASATAHFGPRALLEAEWAATRRFERSGDATRLEFTHDDARSQIRLWSAAASRAFDNPSAGLSGGRSEAGGRMTLRLADRTRVNAEAIYSSDALAQERRSGFLLALDQQLSSIWRGELGTRWANGSSSARANESATASLRVKLSGQWPLHPEWSGYGEYEQDTRELDRRLAALGGEYRFTKRGRLYARHELASTLTSAWALSGSQRQLASVLGVDADLASDAHVFSEYRMSDAIAGREAQAAVGLRNAWRLDSGMRVGASFERVNPLVGAGLVAGPTTALTGSVDFGEDTAWKGSARAEVRTSRASDQFLQTMAAAVKLDSVWTALGRHQLFVSREQAGGGQARERLGLAFAYRPGGQAWDALGRWELRYDRSGGLARSRRVSNILGFSGTGRLTHATRASLSWAGKLTREQAAGILTAGGAQWVQGRLTRDLAQGWDASLTSSVLMGRRFTQRQGGLGIELGRQLPGDIWVSFGFNRFGYRDEELSESEWTREGFFIRLRAKFDEALFQRPRPVQP